MTTPTTPEACRAEQERVLKLLGTYEAACAAFEQAEDAWMCDGDPDKFIPSAPPESVRLKRQEMLDRYADLTDESEALARQYAALLGAYAEALERLERVEGLAKTWQQEVDEDYAPDYYFDEYEPAARAAEKLHWCAKELRAALTPQPTPEQEENQQ